MLFGGIFEAILKLLVQQKHISAFLYIFYIFYIHILYNFHEMQDHAANHPVLQLSGMA